jgi:signal transduction histidine kinase
MFHSIRWRLQLWYGLMLVVVLAGFGFTAFQLQKGRQFRRIDEELQRRVGELANALRAPLRREPGPGRLRPGDPPAGQPPPPGETPLDQPLPGGPPPGRLPPERLPGDGPPNGFVRPPTEFHLQPRQARLFDETDTNGFYYVIWLRDGKELVRSSNVPGDVPRPAQPVPTLPQPPRMRGPYREMYHATPPGEIILAGRSVAPELNELRRAGWLLTATGSVILLLGLAGGWWTGTRAIRPIGHISDTAVKIAAGDLSRRINAADTESELGQLATVLNSTFARLEAAFAEQKQFTSDAAHELRTPVAVVLTQTQTALNRERSPAEYRDTIAACQRAAQRMRRLIESLLELARLDAGQEPMKQLRFDLARTAQDCAELIQPLADEHGVRIQCDLPALACVGDSERLGQVITNLLTNAINYNRPNGEVRLAAQQQDGSIVLTVSDTGQGISAEDLPHVFKRFYRADASRSAGRSGLGLAIAKAIVEAHGGTIEVASQAGAGATFTVRLPAVGA